MISNQELFFRLILSCVLGGLVGIEREKTRHPAGLRTHMLVCTGSALVMLCNLYMFETFKGQTNMDPTRLAAQVISGIGFLGAGTILKEGLSIKGLTTAASLWAVACIGIAIGSGFYLGSIVATLLVLVTLVILPRFEHLAYKQYNNRMHFKIKTIEKPGQLGKITTELGNFQIVIKNISLETEDEGHIIVNISAEGPGKQVLDTVSAALSQIEGVKYFEVC